MQITNVLAEPVDQFRPFVDPSIKLQDFLVDSSNKGCCGNATCSGEGGIEFDIELGGATTGYSCQIGSSAGNAVSLALFTEQFVADEMQDTSAADLDVTAYGQFEGPLAEYFSSAADFWSEFEWDLALPSSDYESMFDMCAPDKCTYTEERRPSWSETATLALGLLGGLTAALKTAIGVLGGTCQNMCCKGQEDKARVVAQDKGAVEVVGDDVENA